MSQRVPGRHRAPSRLSTAGTSLTRTAKATALAATSGGLIAAAVIPADAEPRNVVEDVAPVLGGTSTDVESAIDLLAVVLPPVASPQDRPAVAVASPPPTSKAADGLSFGTTGFEGFTPEPVVEPEPEATAEPQAAAEPEAEPAESSSESASASSTRESSSASRTETRSEAPAASTAPAPTGGVLAVAARYTGIMYQWAGSSPSTGFDCSGYTQYVFAQVGISLPRTAAAQQQMATPVSNPQPGDLVFYGYPAYHMGIYAGNGMMYDSGKPGIPSQLRAVFSGVTGYGRVG